MNNQKRLTVDNYAQYFVAAWMETEFGEWTHVCVWLNPFAIHLKPITTLLMAVYCCLVTKSCPTLV